MTTIKNDELEAEAKTLLRARVERSPWFRQAMSDRERLERIKKEVAAYWHLMIPDAAKRLVDRAVSEERNRAATSVQLRE